MKRGLWIFAAAFCAFGLLACATTGPKVDEAQLAAERRQAAEQHYSIGAGYYAQRNFDAAMENFLRAVETDSTYYDPWIAIGNVWRKRRDPVQAKDAYNKAMALDPRQAKAYEAVGDLYLEMSVVDPALVDSALAVYRQGLSRDSTLVDLYNGIAEIHVMKEETAKADSVYQVALRLFPDDLSVQRLFGEFLFKQRRYGDAVEALKPLVERFANDPGVGKLREKLALAHAEVKQYKEALEQLDIIVAADPTNVDARLIKGVILTKQRKYGDAVAELEGALEQDPNLPMAHIYLADIQIEQGRYSSARGHLTDALALDPDLTVAYVYQGDILRKQGSEQIAGKPLASVSTEKLQAAKGLYEGAKGLYQQGLGDPGYASYCRSQIAYLNSNIDLIQKELFIR
ncbi:tetratricopeptide repeat protein [candidate division WOR-3 bacterium]|nr:tetratricopeptide repeat protein [candidate division WOR-3 bacterium]